MDDNKIISFPITTPEQYKAYLKAEETTMMKVAGKMGYICGTVYGFGSGVLLDTRYFIKHFFKHQKRKHFFKHQKRKNFQVVDEYYGRNTSFARHVLNRVKMRRLARMNNCKDGIIPKDMKSEM